MKKAIILFSLLVSVIPLFAQPQIGRITISQPAEITALQRAGFTIYHDEIPGYLDLLLDTDDITRLKDLGYTVTNLAPLPWTDQTDLDPEYHTYEEFRDELQDFAVSYPDLCKVDSIGQTTQFDRGIWCLKLSDNVQIEEDELALFFIGTHHASEPLGGETQMLMIQTFVEQYGIDPDITRWVDNYETFFIPLLNPDGHYAVTEGINEYWRKNARDIDEDGVYYEFTGGTWWTDDHEGIDLNRNYNWYWELGGSGYMWDYNYRGASPFSESETYCLKPLAVQQRFVCGITFHSYGEVVIYPWYWYSQPAPDQDVLNDFAGELADRFIADDGGTYYTQRDNGREGQCRNWFYGFCGALAFAVELNPYPVFLPPGSELAERTQRYMNGAVYLFERMAGPGLTGHVRDAITGAPLAARVEIQGRISEQVKPRFAEPQYGRYTRLLLDGTYTVLVAQPGYESRRIENVLVQDTLTVLDIDLTPVTVAADNFPRQDLKSTPVDFSTHISGSTLECRYQLIQGDNIHLSLYNLLGQEISHMDQSYQPSGSHIRIMNLQPLPSGIYFVRLTGEHFTSVKKILIQK